MHVNHHFIGASGRQSAGCFRQSTDCVTIWEFYTLPRLYSAFYKVLDCVEHSYMPLYNYVIKH